MNHKKNKSQIGKEELEKVDANLLPLTENVQTNLAQGLDDLTPDSDDIPGGFNLNQTARLDMSQADAEAEGESEEGEKNEKK